MLKNIKTILNIFSNYEVLDYKMFICILIFRIGYINHTFAYILEYINSYTSSNSTLFKNNLCYFIIT